MSQQGIIYVRVSSDEQVKGMSLDFQRQDCLKYAEQKGIDVIDVFEERGESAKYADRPRLNQALEFCRRHQRSLDAFIVWKLDRLSRNQSDYFHIKRRLREWNMAIHSATEPTITDATSMAAKVVETFSALQAEMENDVRTERTKRGMSARIAGGIYPWRPPIGYLPVRNRPTGEKKTTPDQRDPALFPVIQAALRVYGNGGMTVLGLKESLDACGLARLRGRKTHIQLASRMIHEYLDFYAGYITDPWSRERVRGKHEPMLTELEYQRVIAIRDELNGHLRVKKNRFNDLFPLKGTVVCSDCGKPLTGSVSRGHGGKYPYYHCRTQGCPRYARTIKKDALEGAFAEVARRLEFRRDQVEQLIAEVQSEFQEQNQGASILEESARKEIEKQKTRRAMLYEMREDGSYTREEFFKRRAEIEREIAAQEGVLSESRWIHGEMDEMLERVKRFLADLSGKWLEMSPTAKRRFQQLAFPNGMSYNRDSGFGTLICSPVLAPKSGFSETRSPLVAPAGGGWNLIQEELKRISALTVQPE